MKNNINTAIRCLCLFTILLYGIQTVSAQVTGINTQTPDDSSVLDIVSNDKGLLIPRVDLTSATLDLDGQAGQAEGLFVYNTGSTLDTGFYFWDGSEWIKLDIVNNIDPEISALNCDDAVLDPPTFVGGQPYTGTLTVPYDGGNEGKYPQGAPINSTGNTGLQATLKQGTLEFGFGDLIYDVTGTPSASSPTGASFDLSFGTTTVQNCTVTVGDEEELANILEVATLGPLVDTADNGVNGYHREITTPDGKFSVRVFVPDGTTLANSDVQIRSNGASRTIMWNAGVSYQGGNLGTASNAFALLIPDTWYGNSGNNGDLGVVVGTNSAWGDPDVYFNAPEQRSYIWTTTDVTDVTMYKLTFMMGAPNSAVAANDTTAQQTKAFLNVQQTIAD